MAESCRRHSVIDAPIEDVWAIVSDPKTHPDWWPEVEAVRVDGEVGEGDPYTRVTPCRASWRARTEPPLLNRG